MSVPGSEQLEQLMADYRRQFEQLDVIQRGLREISCTVVSPRRTVSVTVGHGGTVKEIKFPTGAYKRMSPAELAGVLVKAIADAQQQAAAQAAALVAPSLPAGVDAGQLFSGEADLRSLLPADADLGADLDAADLIKRMMG